MPLMPFTLPPECPPGTHELAPHCHARMDDGWLKPCGGRFWCTRCRRWQDAEQCVMTGRVVKIPAAWRR